jgi:translation initiation factor 5A
MTQLDISEDGFLSLMADNGDTKDDVKIPDGEVGEKIEKLFRVEEKDTSEFFLWQKCETGELTGLDVIVLTAMGEEVAIEAKEAPRS